MSETEELKPISGEEWPSTMEEWEQWVRSSDGQKRRDVTRFMKHHGFPAADLAQMSQDTRWEKLQEILGASAPAQKPAAVNKKTANGVSKPAVGKPAVGGKVGVKPGIKKPAAAATNGGSAEKEEPATSNGSGNGGVDLSLLYGMLETLTDNVSKLIKQQAETSGRLDDLVPVVDNIRLFLLETHFYSRLIADTTDASSLVTDESIENYYNELAFGAGDSEGND